MVKKKEKKVIGIVKFLRSRQHGIYGGENRGRARDECCLGRQKCKQKCKQKATTCIIAHKSLQVVAIDLSRHFVVKIAPILKLGLYILNTFVFFFLY